MPEKPYPDWMNERTSERERLRRLLADTVGVSLTRPGPPPSSRTVTTEEHGSYLLDRLELDLNDIETVPAYFVRPAGDDGRPRPAVLYFHSHGRNYDLGKRELTDGTGYLATPPYAEVLTSLGMSALCIDQWGFGDRHRVSESALFKRFLWEGTSLYGRMMHDNLRALDYLGSRQDVMSDKIATLGMSMGSSHSWWTAALDERVSLCVDICCLTDYQSLIASGNIDGHDLYYFVPGLLKYFTTASINSLISPRRHLSTAGDNDPLTPPDGLDAVDGVLKKVYGADGASQNWRLERYACAHEEIAPMRKRIVEELTDWSTSGATG